MGGLVRMAFLRFVGEAILTCLWEIWQLPIELLNYLFPEKEFLVFAQDISEGFPCYQDAGWEVGIVAEPQLRIMLIVFYVEILVCLCV